MSEQHNDTNKVALGSANAAAVTGTGTSAQWLARYSDSLMGVFGSPQRVLVRGAGSLVWDADGKDTWTCSAALP